MTAGPKPGNRQAEDPPLPRGTGEVILIVEDDSSLRRMAAIQLRSLGYQVLEAEDGRSALKVLEAEPVIELLLTDIVMPGELSGAELGREGRKRRPDLRLMYMSGYPRAGPEARAQLEKDVILVRKPFRLKQIAITVREALGQQAGNP